MSEFVGVFSAVFQNFFPPDQKSQVEAEEKD